MIRNAGKPTHDLVVIGSDPGGYVGQLNKPSASVVRLPTYIDSSLLRYYSLDESGQQIAARILWQLCESHPQITFAPTLYPLVAIFLHKHDQDYTYHTICQLLQKNHQASRDRQFKNVLMPTTRLEHVRDIIVLIKLCTKFGFFAPFWMRDLVREEKKFLANLERELDSRSSVSSSCDNDTDSGGNGSFTNKKKSRRSSRFRLSRTSNNNLSNGNSHSHNNNNNHSSTKRNLPIFDTPFSDWYKWIFLALPLAYCTRIVDCWLVDGQKFLYQVALAMLDRFRQQCDSPVTLTSEKMFEFCSRLEIILEPKGGVEQLIKEAKSLKRISTVTIAKASKKSETKASLIVESIMRKDSQNFKLYNSGQKSYTIQQPREDMLKHIIISSRIAPRSFKSSIVDNYDLLDDLWQYIPERAAVKTVSVVFNSNNDGTSLQTFFSRVDPYDETIIIIRTIKNEVFGSYCSSSWSLRKNQAQSAAKKSYYFGNGETFLFTLQPKFSVYLWVGKTESDQLELDHLADISTAATQEQQQQQQSPRKPLGHRDSVTESVSTQLFMSATSQELIIGSGNGSFGLWLDADLTRGKTDHCRTFNNLPLCEEKDFTCKDVEVLAFA
uniref:TBC1 domain family member 24 n=1 Tax=Aceria tosichella TaxID=561515 RepID=A0A6G1SGW7_9ACAR